MQEELGISSPQMTYYIESLQELVYKKENGEYELSTFGKAAINTMKVVEEAPTIQSKHRLPLTLKWKSLFAVLLIGMVLLASISYVQYSSLNQLTKELESIETNYQRLQSLSAGTSNAITFLQDVIQIDLTKYQATLMSNTVEVRSDLGGVVEEILKYSLANSESQIDVILRFRNNNLSRYQLNLFEGSVLNSQPQPGNILDAAKDLLQRFRAYKDASHLEDMNNLLDLVNKTENMELIKGNIKLKISNSGDSTQLQWMYTKNGVDFSAKSLTLVFQNRVLKELTDGWFLFTIGSTNVNVSKEGAIEIARNYAKTFTWKTEGVEVSDFTVLSEPVSAELYPHPREVPLALIPYWYVTLYLDKVYPGGVNRIAVGVWADTGEVVNVQTLTG